MRKVYQTGKHSMYAHRVGYLHCPTVTLKGHSHIRETRRGEAARQTRVQESATESKLVKRGKARRGKAVPCRIACHDVQYVHSGSIHK